MSSNSVTFRFVVNRRIAKLCDQIREARKALESAFALQSVLDFAEEHIEIAEEHYQDAVEALKYNNAAQAFNEIEPGLFCVALGRTLLFRATGFTAQQKSNANETEQSMRHLATALTKAKSMIEYMNLDVTPLARRFLDAAMERYDLAYDKLRAGNHAECRRQSEAGLLCIRFADLVLRHQNSEGLPGIGAVANPLIGRPVRDIGELARQLADISEFSEEKSDESFRGIANYHRALHNFEMAIQGIAENNVPGAQAQVNAGLQTLKQVREDFALNVTQAPSDKDPLEKTEEERLRSRFTELSAVAKSVGETLIATEDVERRLVIREHILSITRHHRNAVESFCNGDYTKAREEAAAALLQIDLVKTLTRLKE
jgi:hypothetical protein